MTKKGLYAKDTEFWVEVNKKLNIPDDAYESKQSRQQAEREQVLLEKKAKEQAEEERLLANKKEIRRENRKDWKITVFELPESDIFGKRFVAEYTREPDLPEKTWFCNTKGDAYSQACNCVDELERREESSRIFMEHYAVMKDLYLMIIYLSSRDQHNSNLNNSRENSKRMSEKFFCIHLTLGDPPKSPLKRGTLRLLFPPFLRGVRGDQQIFDTFQTSSKENFTGVDCWNGFDFEIINALVAEGLLEFSSNKNKLIMKKQAMKAAREILQKINIDGVDRLLEQREYHEEYINYMSPLDIMEEQEEDEE